MMRIIAAVIVTVFIFETLAVDVANAGMIDKLMKTYVAVKTVKRAGQAVRLVRVLKPKMKDAASVRSRAIEIRQHIRELESHSTAKLSIRQFRDLKLQMKSNSRTVRQFGQDSREAFNRNKDKLIKQWEKDYGQEWSKYKEIVKTKGGKERAQPGDYYDAHHIIPLKYGGKNTSANIFPSHTNGHISGIHGRYPK